MTFGERLSVARKAQHVTQKQLADRIGVSRGVITYIETNRVGIPQSIVIDAICSVLQVKKEWLVDGKGSMQTGEMDPKTELKAEINNYMDAMDLSDLTYVLNTVKSLNKYIKKQK